MSIKTVFTAENEICYEMPLQVIKELIYKGILQVIKTELIEQEWLHEAQVTRGIKMKSRIRCTQIVGSSDAVHCTYDTKYYLTEQKRIELSAPLTFPEYRLLKCLYKGAEKVNKRRLLLKDIGTLFTYEVDIYNGNPNARVEIEFDSEEEMRSFEAPEWLAKWRKA